MTHSRDDLVALLHDYADADPARPVDMSGGVHRRIMRRRRSRITLAASATVVALAVTGGLVQFATRPTASSPAGLVLPAPVFVDNGVTYTRAKVAYLDTTKHRSVTVSIPPGDMPVAVFASCKLHDRHSKKVSAVALSTVAGYEPSGGIFSCTDGLPHTTQVTRAALPAGGTRVRFTIPDSYADAPADAPATWAFAIYTTTLPASIGDQGNPAASIIVADTPSTLAGTYSLVHTYSGFWPAQRSARITIPAGAPSVVVFQCQSPLINQRIQLPGVTDSTYVNGASLTCLAPGHTPSATADMKGIVATDAVAQLGLQRPPAMTVSTSTTFTLTFDPEDQTHPGQWTVAVYQR